MGVCAPLLLLLAARRFLSWAIFWARRLPSTLHMGQRAGHCNLGTDCGGRTSIWGPSPAAADA
eukprot:16000811-Heterocapsa_arctica.AAC.1